MFEKTLSDLVKGLRSNKRNESEYIGKAIAEIREELRTKKPRIQAEAILKLIYLQMLGHDMSWASFHCVEVMSSPKFVHRRIGYLGAAVSFTDETDVSLLCINLFKKDFASANPFELGIAVNCMANICTVDMAQSLASDIVGLLNSSRAYVRKKCVLVLYKLFLKFPEALRPSFPRIKEKLEDADTGVVSCAVNVVCELARKNPQNYLSLAPLFFKLLTVTSNNWMLIKIVKLLGALCPLEPRLSKKLVEPLGNLINTTPAKSLLYECIHTASIGMTAHMNIVKLCMDKLKYFVEDPDQNLKYLGLVAMHNFMLAHPKVVSDHQAMILKCLDDEDVTIRHRALGLVSGMVSRKNLQEIVRILMEHISSADGGFRDDLILKIVEVSSANGYENITNFEWYITTLCQIARIGAAVHGKTISFQLMDVIIRVKTVRPFGVKNMTALLVDDRIYSFANNHANAADVLYAAAYIVGEYAEEIDDPVTVIGSLTHKRVHSLPEHVQAIFMQNLLKVYIEALSRLKSIPRVALPTQSSQSSSTPSAPATSEPAVGDLLGELSGGAPSQKMVDLLSDFDPLAEPKAPAPAPVVVAAVIEPVIEVKAQEAAPEDIVLITELTKAAEAVERFTRSVHVDVQERACSVSRIINLISSLPTDQSRQIIQELASIFAEELNPVAPKAQKKVKIPDDLDLDTPINEPEPIPDEEDHVAALVEGSTIFSADDIKSSDTFSQPTAKDIRRMEREAKKAREKRKTDPFYLPQKTLKDKDIDGIPIYHLEPDDAPVDEHKPQSEHRSSRVKYDIVTADEMPEGAELSDEDSKKKRKSKKGAAVPGGEGEWSKLDIDISKPLGKDEVLPQIKQYERVDAHTIMEERARKERREKKEKKDREEKEHKRHSGDVAAAADEKKSERKHRDKDEKHRSNKKEDEDGERHRSSKHDKEEKSSRRDKDEKSSRSHKDDGHRSSRRDKEKDDGDEKSKHRSSSKRDEEKSDKHRSSRHKEEDSSSRSKSASASSGALTSADAPPPRRTIMLCRNEDVAVGFTILVDGDSELAFPIKITVKNIGGSEVSGVSIQLVDSLNMRLKRSDGQASGAPLSAPFDSVPAGGDGVMNIEFRLNTVTSPQKPKGSLTYRVGGTEKNLPFQFSFPCSYFLFPIKIGIDDFATALSGGQCSNSASVTVSAPADPTAINSLRQLLRLTVVQTNGAAISMYTRSIGKHHVAVLAKQKADTNTLSVDLKCSDESLASALINEVAQIFGGAK